MYLGVAACADNGPVLRITHERNQNRVGGRAQAGPQPYRRPVACARSAGVALADALLIALHRYSPGGEYDGNEYGGLPVKPVFGIILCCNVFRCTA